MQTGIKTKNWSFIIIIGMLAIGANYGLGQVASIAALAVIIIKTFLSSDEDNFYFSLFLISNIRIFDNLGATYYVNFLLTFPFFIFMFRKGLTINAKYFSAGLILFLIEFAHMVVLDNWNNLYSFLAWILAFYYCTTFTINNKVLIDKSKVFWYFSVGIVFSSILYLINNWDYTSNIVNYILEGARFKAYAGEPNYFALYICIAIALIFELPQKGFKSYLMLSFLLMVALLTSSKMAITLILIVFISVALYTLLGKNTSINIKNKKFVITSILFVGVIMSFARDFISQLIDKIFSRAGIGYDQATNISHITTGRSDILLQYVEVLSTNSIALFFGYGLNYNKHLVGMACHNTFLDVLLAWGIIGLVVFGFVILMWFSDYRKVHQPKANFLSVLPSLILCAGFFSLSCFNANMFFFIITICMIQFGSSRTLQDSDVSH